jgi:tRNA(fMet)-specific endonuclease VapC
MTYIWDTNILIHIVKNPLFSQTFTQQYDLSNPLNKSCISAVTVGEVHAFAFRNRWGHTKMRDLVQLLQTLEVVDITNDPSLIQMYAEIDAYSQSQHPVLKLPHSARRMGKNDLWIAATTAVYNAVLLSTDNDFTHLDGLFLAFDKISA